MDANTFNIFRELGIKLYHVGSSASNPGGDQPLEMVQPNRNLPNAENENNQSENPEIPGRSQQTNPRPTAQKKIQRKAANEHNINDYIKDFYEYGIILDKIRYLGGRYWNFISFARYIIFLTIIVGLQHLPKFQIFILAIIQLFMTIYFITS